MRARAARTWKMPWGMFWVAVLALIGVLLLCYPSTANWFAQAEQSRLIQNTTAVIASLEPEERNGQLEEARAYNLALTGGAVLQAGASKPTAEDDAAVAGENGIRVLNGEGTYDYDSLLRITDDGVMARLKISAIQLDLPVYHGTSAETLEKGVGHLEGTALPVGGESMHTVFTAHRGLPSAELFTRLDEVRLGDRFTVEVAGEVLVYRVIDTRIVEPDQTEFLHPQQHRDLLTLVTCTPLGVNSHRILVTGERVTPTPVAEVTLAGAAPTIPGFPWWAVAISATCAGLILAVWRSGIVRTVTGAPAVTTSATGGSQESGPTE